MATTNAPWAEIFIPPPGGPPEVYQPFEEDYLITRGPEGIYTRPGRGFAFLRGDPHETVLRRKVGLPE